MFGGRKNSKARIEPSFDSPLSVSGKRNDLTQPKLKSASLARPPKRARRGFLGGLFYWSFVLSIWGLIGVSGLLVFHFNQLPPIDQLSVPKRPPNIAILAEDGSLVANRGDTGGAAVHLRDLPPYLPKAFVSIVHPGVNTAGKKYRTTGPFFSA